jgi:hypothetical protein
LNLNLALRWGSLGDLIRIAAGDDDGAANADDDIVFDLKAEVLFKNVLGNIPKFAALQAEATPCDTFCGRFEADGKASGMWDWTEWRLAFPEPKYDHAKCLGLARRILIASDSTTSSV